jgi:glycosyltransferase involved in cell wall biosynthesis
VRIVVFSLGPVFPDRVHGGSQKILADVICHLGALGHTVNVYCTSRPDNTHPFQLASGVYVSPTLEFKPTYPEPYYAPPFRLASVVSQLGSALEQADVFYIHDGELVYHFLYRDIPTVVSFRDFVYPDTLAGAFSFRRDALILSSEYVARCVNDAFAMFCPEVRSRMNVIPNGIDLDMFRPGRGDEIADLIDVPHGSINLLYPHRPDPRKGIFECLEVLSRLRPRLGHIGCRLKLLIPLWMDGDIATGSQHVYQTVYEHIRERARALGVHDLLVFHPWVPMALMPAYYALGTATLCIGTFVEAFGNVALESAACGTRPIVSRVAAHRTLLPDSVTTKVAPLDLDGVVEAIEDAIERPYAVDDVRRTLASSHSYQSMLMSYERVITSTTLSDPLRESFRQDVANDDILDIPAWCHYEPGRGYYNDYLHEYSTDPALIELVTNVVFPVTVAQLVTRGAPASALSRLVHSGALVRRDA